MLDSILMLDSPLMLDSIPNVQQYSHSGQCTLTLESKIEIEK